MNKRRLYWICQIVGWGLIGLGQLLIYYSANDSIDPAQIFIELLRAVYNIFITHELRKMLIRLGLLKQKWSRLFPKIILLLIIMGISNLVILTDLTYIWDPGTISFNLADSILDILEPTFYYLCWCVIYFLFHYFERYNKSLQYEVAINEFELNSLKTQLNPHFIFNALNSIRALVDEDPKKSKTAITRLSNIMRNSLILDKKKLISFNEELSTVKDYLELELIRYEERLQLEFDIARESSDFNVPPMMIQTLVENGIKHGIGKLTKGGKISVKTRILNHNMVIDIRNSGQYHSSYSKKDSMGYGLKNTRKRLDLIYGTEASFLITNEDNNTVLTRITIPETI